MTDDDKLIFDDNLADKTITITADITIEGDKNITIIGNGVTITSSSNKKLNFGKLNSPLKNVRLEKINFVTIQLFFNSPITASNCTFTSPSGASSYTGLSLSGSEILFEGCAFIAENNDATKTLRIIENSSTPSKNVSFVSCSFVRNYTSNYPLLSFTNNKNSVETRTFTNCIFVDPNNTNENSTIKVSEQKLIFKGYNVIQGTINGYWERMTKNHDTDIILGKGDNSPLYYEGGIYKVVGADNENNKSPGPAYKLLPANPDIEGVSFPEYDLTGTKIDYTKKTHSGAWQVIYGDEYEEPVIVYPTQVTISGTPQGNEIICNELNTPKTLKLTASVLPYNYEGGVEWKSSNDNVATIDDKGNVRIFFMDGTNDKHVIFTATTKINSAAGDPVTSSVTLTVKSYVHVTALSFAIGVDTIRSLRSVEHSLEEAHQPTVAPENAINKKYTWSIKEEDKEIADLTYNNVRKAWTLKGKKAGTVTLKAIMDEDNELSDSCVYVFHEPYYSDVKGAFFLTEGTYPACGEIHFINEENNVWDTYIYSTLNNGQVTGITTQFASIYGDNFYFISKQQNRLVIADKTTLAQRKSFKHIYTKGENQKVMDGRAFLGVDENTGYLGTSSGICVVNFNELLTTSADDNKVVTELPYTPITGTESEGGEVDGNGNPLDPNLYKEQVGTMIRVGDRVFAVQQNSGIHVINALTHQMERTLTGNYAVLTQSKDGSLWAGATVAESAGELGETSKNILVRINTWTLEIEEITIPAGYAAPPSTWGAWQADVLCGSTLENKIYWMNSGAWLGRYIYEYDIDKKSFSVFFDSHEYPTVEGYPNEKFNMYGCPFRVHPETGELYVTLTTWHINPIIVKTVHLKIDSKTKQYTRLPQGPTEPWSALWIFPDNYAPVIAESINAISLEATHPTDTLYLGDKITDADNMDAAIIKSVLLKENEYLISVKVWRDSLIVTPLKEVTEDTQTTFTLKANSNGKVVTKEITVTVKAGTDPGIITNPFELTQKTASLKAGQTVQLSITAPQIYDVTWRSTNTTVAIVDGNGLVGALKAGTTKIIAEDKARNKADTCVVTVTTTDTVRPVYSLKLNTSQLILNQGERTQIQATLSPSTAGLPAIVWKSSHPAVADVTSSGSVVGLSAGAAMITATFADTLIVSCMVTVRDIKAEVKVEHLSSGSVELTFPQMSSASYYMLHLYKKVGTSRTPVVALKVNPNSRTTIGLRSTSSETSVVLNGLENGVKYEADIEIFKENSGKAEVISTLYATFSGENSTSNIEIDSKKANVYYRDGLLIMKNLEGCQVTLYSINGQPLSFFSPSGDLEHYPVSVAKGVYILTAVKDFRKEVFKVIIR